MNRRSFIQKLFMAAGAVAAGPVVLDVAKAVLTQPVQPVHPAWVRAEFEASFVIPNQEMVDWLVGRTAWHWNDLTLKNLVEGVRKNAT